MINRKCLSLILIFIILFQAISPVLYKSYATELNDMQIDMEQETEKQKIDEEDEIIDVDFAEDNIEKTEQSMDVENNILNHTSILNEDEIISSENEVQTNTIINEIQEEVVINNDETEEKKEQVESIQINQNEVMLMSTGNGDFYVGNEVEFRNALANRAETIRVRQSIDFSAPLYIDYNVKIADESSNNSLRYAGGGSFIIVQNGATLTLSGMVIDTNSSGMSGMTAINIQTGGCVTFINSSIVDGGLGNTGILVNDGANLLLWSSKIVRCGLGINLQNNGKVEFATQEGRLNEFYWNNVSFFIDNFYGNCYFNQNITMHDNTTGILTANVSGNVDVSTGTYYNNQNAIDCGGNLTVSGGSFYNNKNAIYTNGKYSGRLIVTGGNIYSNTNYAIYHDKTNDGGCTVIGGTISDVIYLAQNDNYVNTNTNYPSFTVTPSAYFFKRKLVKTASNSIANNEIGNITLTQKDNWYKYVFNEYIVIWKNCNIIVRCYDQDVANGKVNINGKKYTNPVYLKGATFNILDSNRNILQTLTTDNNGYAISKELPAQTTYIIEQKNTIPNYKTNSQKLTVNFTDETYTANFPNEHNKGKLSISKVDYDDNMIGIAGVKFNLYSNKVDTPYSKGSLIGTFTTDEKGKIVINDVWTGSYYFVETETLKTYNLDTTHNEVIIKSNETSEEIITNEKKKDKIEIYVKDDDTDIPLDNIEFDILDEDGSVVDTITTDEEGYAISKNLPIDEKYTVIQKTNKDNYIPNEDKIEVDFIKEFGYEDEQIYTIDITNKHKKGNIELTKVDFDNNDLTLSGFEFELYVKNVDAPYKEGDFIGTYRTDENGKIQIKDLWIGEYYFKEIESEDSYYYQLITDNIDVKVDENETTIFTIENEKKKGQIEISKKTSSNYSKITGFEEGTALEGAEFNIIDENGEVVDTIITNNEGYAISNKLPINKVYTIKEIGAPEYYLIDDREEKIKFTNNGEIKTLEWKNEAVSANIEIEQKGIIETQANDLIKYDFTILKNNSNVEIDNFILEDNLPYEYVTLKSLYTGTYNYEHNYTIWYKTDGQWNQMINSNSEDGTYNSFKNNYIEFSNINTKITHIKIQFGTVEADFSAKEEDMPFVYVKVNENVESNIEFTNRTLLKGEYKSNRENAISLEDSSEWRTRVYSNSLELNSEQNKNGEKSLKRNILPRTGF